MIKALVFDMGGVLIRLNGQRCVDAFKKKAGFDDIEDYLDLFHQKGFIGEFEKGAINEDEFYRRCLEHCRPGTTPDVLEECLDEILVDVNPSAVSLIKECEGKYPMYVLSNNNPISLRCFEKMLVQAGIPMDKVFKEIFFSFRMKVLKPSREIYERMIAAIGLPPEEILFIDDSEKNVTGAEAVGLKTLHYRPDGDLRTQVEILLSGRY